MTKQTTIVEIGALRVKKNNKLPLHRFVKVSCWINNKLADDILIYSKLQIKHFFQPKSKRTDIFSNCFSKTNDVGTH